MDTPDRKLEPRIDREGLKARLRTVIAQPRSESKKDQAELTRQLAEVCPDEKLLLELLDENDRGLMRELGREFVADGITMEVFRRILRALPSRDVEDERQEDEEDGVVDDDLEDGGREGDGEI